MEQKYEKVGSMILNPARLWKNVLAEPPRHYPVVALYNHILDDDWVIQNIINHEWKSNPKFIVLSKTKIDVPSGVDFYSFNQLTDEDRISLWKKVDILYTRYLNLGYEAGLSGVDVIHSEVDLHVQLTNIWVGSSQRRVEAYDRTCRSLDTI